MATIIITIVLNLLIGSPAEVTKDQTKANKPDKENTISTNGGSGAWTNVEK